MNAAPTISAATTGLPRLWLIRHGETEWSAAGRHTGRTDIALTAAGEQAARGLAPMLARQPFARVFTSPLQRARRTCELAGFAARAETDVDLLEWDYGAYEGRRALDIGAERPGWELFRDGCPDGETLVQVAERARGFIARVRALDADVLAFSSGHLLRVLAACWGNLDPAAARVLYLDTTALAVLGYHHDRQDPVLRLWNETSFT
ncbi:MAG: histidine phosphatase family protein [Steroidobacteraceae bacterium]